MPVFSFPSFSSFDRSAKRTQKSSKLQAVYKAETVPYVAQLNIIREPCKSLEGTIEIARYKESGIV